MLSKIYAMIQGRSRDGREGKEWSEACPTETGSV